MMSRTQLSVVILALGLFMVSFLSRSAQSASVSAHANLSPVSETTSLDHPSLVTVGGPELALQHPNIVFILTDDLDNSLQSLDHLPRLKTLMADRGTTFANHFVSLSLCCPSRSTTLRGQYAHNTDIFTNTPPSGGFQAFHQLGRENSTVATWLQAAGYRTVLMGKYLNGYPDGVTLTYIPPGWSEWYSPASGNPYSEYNYRMNENGHLVQYGSQPQDYMVDVLSNKAQDFIQRASADHQPFFMYITPYAPHQPATPAPRYANDFATVTVPRPPSFNEPDVNDKPDWIKSRPLLTQVQIDQLDTLYRKRLQSMEAVEDLLENVINALRTAGQIDNTYIFFTSDNGFHMGEHRLDAGKNTMYEEDLKVPLIVRGPGVPTGRSVEAITANVDYAPTFAALAHASAPEFVDGRSLVPLLEGGPSVTATWRRGLLLEHAALEDDAEPAAPSSSGPTSGEQGHRPLTIDPGLLEPPDLMDISDRAAKVQQGIPPFVGVRTANLVYVEYQTGEIELYDLRNDPYELRNIASIANADALAQLSIWAHRLQDCVGERCRAEEVTGEHLFLPLLRRAG